MQPARMFVQRLANVTGKFPIEISNILKIKKLKILHPMLYNTYDDMCRL